MSQRSRSRSASPKPKEVVEVDEQSESIAEHQYNYDNYAYYVMIMYKEYEDEDERFDLFFANKGELSRDEAHMLTCWAGSDNYIDDYLAGYSNRKIQVPKKKDKLKDQPTTIDEVRQHRMLQERFATTFFSHCHNCDCVKNRIKPRTSPVSFSVTDTALIILKAGERPETFHE